MKIFVRKVSWIVKLLIKKNTVQLFRIVKYQQKARKIQKMEIEEKV
jgi:hypothetical protein